MDAIAAYFAHANSGDFEKLAACFAPDASVTVPGAAQTRGRAKIEELYGRIFAPWAEHHDDPVRTVRAGGTATVDVRFTGVLAGGHRMAFDAVDVFDLDDHGLIARLTSWYDSHAVRKEMAANRAVATPAELEPLRERLNALGISAALGIECIELRPRAARVTMDDHPAARDASGALPVALVAALADVAASFAVHTVIGPEDLHVTAELTTHFLAPAGERLVAEAMVLGHQRRNAFASARISDGERRLCAVATGSWAVTPS